MKLKAEKQRENQCYKDLIQKMISKIDKLLARLIKKKRKEDTNYQYQQ